MQPALKRIKIFDYELCAGGEGADTKKGDGGVPLMCESKSGKWNVVGLSKWSYKIINSKLCKFFFWHLCLISASWGIGGAPQPGVPGIYTNVASFLDWLQEFVQKQREVHDNLVFPRPDGTRKPLLVDPSDA